MNLEKDFLGPSKTVIPECPFVNLAHFDRNNICNTWQSNILAGAQWLNASSGRDTIVFLPTCILRNEKDGEFAKAAAAAR